MTTAPRRPLMFRRSPEQLLAAARLAADSERLRQAPVMEMIRWKCKKDASKQSDIKLTTGYSQYTLHIIILSILCIRLPNNYSFRRVLDVVNICFDLICVQTQAACASLSRPRTCALKPLTCYGPSAEPSPQNHGLQNPRRKANG